MLLGFSRRVSPYINNYPPLNLSAKKGGTYTGYFPCNRSILETRPPFFKRPGFCPAFTISGVVGVPLVSAGRRFIITRGLALSGLSFLELFFFRRPLNQSCEELSGWGFRLYERNFKGFFSSTTPPSIYNPYYGFSLVERAFVMYLKYAYHRILNWSIKKWTCENYLLMISVRKVA